MQTCVQLRTDPPGRSPSPSGLGCCSHHSHDVISCLLNPAQELTGNLKRQLVQPSVRTVTFLLQSLTVVSQKQHLKERF